ncbi:lipopolysaccharide assembly protein LapA domain-containing protein [Brucella gallinifaecis]|uniref:LapA family protein n=1 Tax=Brucella gallinifaecis TaxID=215590 RepID=A0A502BMW3_9HYPH|nr:LapA family protein [Brucella gallinifaecis]TPF75485.1 LapA family protein [Brucella gallinifaecis]
MAAKRIVTIVIFVPLAIILIALSVANRQSIGLTIDPFNPGNPALTYQAPLFIWLFGALILGALIGAAVTWLAQGKHRRRNRAYKKETSQLLDRAETAEKRHASGPLTKV